MTNKELIAKIRAEIERRITISDLDNPIGLWSATALTSLISFLSDLEKSLPAKVTDGEELEKEIERYFPESAFDTGWNYDDMQEVAHHFYELGCRRTAEKYDEIEYNRQRAEESVQKGLEETKNPEPFFYCKYGGIMEMCSDCKRSHLNSTFEKEDIQNWFSPSNLGTKQCGEYIQMDELENPAQDGLEEAAEEYAKEHSFHPCDYDVTPYDCFIAGAKWQKEQHKSVPGKYTEMDFESARNTFSEDVYNHNRKNKTPIDMVDLDDAFETGADWMEKQMLKEAVEADVNTYRDLAAGKNWAEFVVEMPTNNLGDKVRVIIIPYTDGNE